MWLWQWLGGVVVQGVLVGSVWGKCLIDPGDGRAVCSLCFPCGQWVPACVPVLWDLWGSCKRVGRIWPYWRGGQWSHSPGWNWDSESPSSCSHWFWVSNYRGFTPVESSSQPQMAVSSQLPTETGCREPRELQGLLCTWHPRVPRERSASCCCLLTSLCTGALAISVLTLSLQADGASAVLESSFINCCWYLVSWKNEHLNLF